MNKHIMPSSLSRAGIVREKKPSITTVPKAEKIGKNEGIDELLQCLNPATFDIACIYENTDWLLNNALNTIYLNCALGNFSVDVSDPDRQIAHGSCNSWFGIPGIAQPQQCDRFSAVKPATTCQTGCTAKGYTFEAAGCDGMDIWCWCRES
jgi:hypothetical protein